MELIKPNININFIGQQKLWGTISGIGVIVSLILAFIFPGLKYGIDFTGGTEIQLQFKKDISIDKIRSTLVKLGYPSAEVVSVGEKKNEYIIRVKETSPITKEQREKAEKAVRESFKDIGVLLFSISESGDKLEIQFREEIEMEKLANVLKESGLEIKTDEREKEESRCKAGICRLLPLNQYRYEAQLKGIGATIVGGLKDILGSDVVPPLEDVERIDYIGPKVGHQLKTAGIKSILYALGFILLYIAFRFDLRFAPGAIIALIHDAIITVGFFAITRREFSLPIIAALLTIVGYSINDTIVVFDRIRENLQRLKERELTLVINSSINQTLSRTVLTSLTTLFTTIAIVIFGGGMIRDFAIALTVGIIVGTYSSIFIASPVIILLDKLVYSRK